MNKRNEISVILESTTAVCTPSDIHIIHEEKINIGDKRADKVFFRTKLQTACEQNANHRWYSRDIIHEIVNGLKNKAKNRSLFQEIDHPFVAGNGTDDTFKKRAVIVELKNCGSLIRDIYTEGNDVIAEIETLSGLI